MTPVASSHSNKRIDGRQSKTEGRPRRNQALSWSSSDARRALAFLYGDPPPDLEDGIQPILGKNFIWSSCRGRCRIREATGLFAAS